MNLLDEMKFRKHKEIMDKIGNSQVYQLLIKKLTDIFEMPERPDDPLLFLQQEQIHSIDYEFLQKDIQRMQEQNIEYNKEIETLQKQLNELMMQTNYDEEVKDFTQ